MPNLILTKMRTTTLFGGNIYGIICCALLICLLESCNIYRASSIAELEEKDLSRKKLKVFIKTDNPKRVKYKIFKRHTLQADSLVGYDSRKADADSVFIAKQDIKAIKVKQTGTSLALTAVPVGIGALLIYYMSLLLSL